MTIPDFVVLSLNDRAQVLWDHGKYLETIVYYGQTVKLYALNSFFVEVYYAPVTQSIEKVAVVYEEGLKKYLGRIKFTINNSGGFYN
jgi:hypothetical protein